MNKGDKLILTIGYVLITLALVNMIYANSNIMSSNLRK